MSCEIGRRAILHCCLHKRDCKLHPDDAMLSRQDTRAATESCGALEVEGKVTVNQDAPMVPISFGSKVFKVPAILTVGPFTV